MHGWIVSDMNRLESHFFGENSVLISPPGDTVLVPNGYGRIFKRI